MDGNNEMKTVLAVRDMYKSFGETKALRGVSLDLRAGEVLGLIGENGSGKSTITSIVAGMQKCDAGEVTYLGRAWQPASMIEALENGIGMIVQESGTIPGISVAENIFLADTDGFKRGFLIDRKAMIRAAQVVLEKIGIRNVHAEDMTQRYDIQSRKLIEIARVMRKEPAVLFVDETTTALSHEGRDILYGIVNRMRDEGKSVIFISHDMEEILRVCDRLTVLRDGEIIRSFERNEYNEDEIKACMIGRKLEGDYYRNDYEDSCLPEVAIRIENLEAGGMEPVHDFSLEVHRGEIVGIGGLSQCGMHTLGKAMFGAVKAQGGSVTAAGGRIKDEADAMSRGIAYVSKNRDTESLVLDAPIGDNISVGGLDKFAVGKNLILPGREKAYVDRQIETLQIKCRSRNQYVNTLSGGNKQKVVFGKWIGRDSDILILDCPTRGIDIGVKQAMYHLMTKLKLEGKALIIISEEMAELIGMADRIIIMKDGRKSGELARHDRPQEADIIGYMI